MKMTCYPNSLDPQAVHSVKLWKKQMGTGLKRFCLMIYFSLQIYSSRQWLHMQNLSFLVRLTLLIIPLVVMIRHKHLHSKEPYSVWTKTNTRSVIIFPSQIQIVTDTRWGGLIWRHVSNGSADVASSKLPNTQSMHKEEVAVGRSSSGSVTSRCKGFLNTSSCWYYFQIRFLYVNQLFLLMH